MSAAPPYPEPTAPQTVPLNSGPQPTYPNQNVVPGQYQYSSPLLKQEASLQPPPPGAVNAMPRTYQQPFWASRVSIILLLILMSICPYQLMCFTSHMHTFTDQFYRRDLINHKIYEEMLKYSSLKYCNF